MSMSLVLRPRMSEKAYGLSQVRNTYVFDVPGDSNKLQVAKAVEIQYGVTVEEVNISIVKGKIKRAYRKGSRPGSGKRSDIKKAYVRLKAGDSLPLFEAEEQEDAKEAKKGAK